MKKNNKRERYYGGVWSNGKKIIDLDNLNTKAEIVGIKACCLGNTETDSDDRYYITKSGIAVHTYRLVGLEDWFADIGACYSEKKCYKIMGRNFKKIKFKGEEDPEWILFNESCIKRYNKEN